MLFLRFFRKTGNSVDANTYERSRSSVENTLWLIKKTIWYNFEVFLFFGSRYLGLPRSKFHQGLVTPRSNKVAFLVPPLYTIFVSRLPAVYPPIKYAADLPQPRFRMTVKLCGEENYLKIREIYLRYRPLALLGFFWNISRLDTVSVLKKLTRQTFTKRIAPVGKSI